MKKIILASACILALSVGGAVAQTQPAPGPGATKSSTTKHIKSTKHMKTTKHMRAGTTVGMGSGARVTKKGMSSNPSSEGNVGPGTNNNAGKQPGGR